MKDGKDNRLLSLRALDESSLWWRIVAPPQKLATCTRHGRIEGGSCQALRGIMLEPVVGSRIQWVILSQRLC